jgi:hypothetical protein
LRQYGHIKLRKFQTWILFIPTLLLVDLDKEHFRTAEEFEAAAANSNTNFKDLHNCGQAAATTYFYLSPPSPLRK